MKGQIRQGDILLVPVTLEAPVGCRGKSEVILAEGEVTGHAHRLAAVSVLEWEAGGQRYVQVAGHAPGTLSHEDHDPSPAAVVEPGVTYRVVQQHQFSLADEWERVHD